MSSSSPIFLYSILSLLAITFAAAAATDLYAGECRIKACNSRSPPVRFPFWLHGHHPPHCGLPEFNLSCSPSKKQTLLNLPNTAQFKINSIDYKSRTISLQDPRNCLATQLPKLNLTSTPFNFFMEDNFFYSFSKYVFFNCSASASNDPRMVRCLSDKKSGFFVKAFYADSAVLEFSMASCRRVEETPEAVPMALIDFQKERVLLNWSAAEGCGRCEEERRGCRLKNGGDLGTECFDFPTQGLSEKLITTGAIVGSFLLILLPIGFYHIHRSYVLEKEHEIKIKQFLEDYKALKSTRYTYADIKRITKHFKQKLGQGGYGTVYKGKLSNNILVAVKILNNNSSDNGEEFINEVGAMGRIHHVNVARLVGFCADGPNRALVYEFLANESLEKFIFSEGDKRVALGWERLQDIALGIAKGMEYLHHGCNQQILHFDIKPHNILLDQNFVPKISDFGLAKLCSKEKSVVTMIGARGTVGYIAPEVASRNFGKPSYKSDVYSFGMLLLEMVGGRRNIDGNVQNPSQVYYPEWVYKRVEQGAEIGIEIQEEEDGKIVNKLTIVALKCIQWYPIDRPSMKVVVQMLEGDGENLAMPPNPFSSGDGSQKIVAKPSRAHNLELEIISEAE